MTRRSQSIGMLPSDRLDVFEADQSLTESETETSINYILDESKSLLSINLGDQVEVDYSLPLENFTAPLALFGITNIEGYEDVFSKYKITKPLNARFVKNIMSRLVSSKEFHTQIPVGLDIDEYGRLHNGYLHLLNTRKIFRTFEIPTYGQKTITVNMDLFTPFFEREENILKYNAIARTSTPEIQYLFDTRDMPPYKYFIQETNQIVCKVVSDESDLSSLPLNCRAMLKYGPKTPIMLLNMEEKESTFSEGRGKRRDSETADR